MASPAAASTPTEALGFCKVFDMTLDELASPPGKMANPIIRRLVGEYVELWKEWRSLGKSMDAIQDQLREYTKANPDQDTMVRNLLAHELDAASNGDFHRHKGARSRLSAGSATPSAPRPPTLPSTPTSNPPAARPSVLEHPGPSTTAAPSRLRAAPTTTHTTTTGPTGVGAPYVTGVRLPLPSSPCP